MILTCKAEIMDLVGLWMEVEIEVNQRSASSSVARPPSISCLMRLMEASVPIRGMASRKNFLREANDHTHECANSRYCEYLAQVNYSLRFATDSFAGNLEEAEEIITLQLASFTDEFGEQLGDLRTDVILTHGTQIIQSLLGLAHILSTLLRSQGVVEKEAAPGVHRA